MVGDGQDHWLCLKSATAPVGLQMSTPWHPSAPAGPWPTTGSLSSAGRRVCEVVHRALGLALKSVTKNKTVPYLFGDLCMCIRVSVYV